MSQNAYEVVLPAEAAHTLRSLWGRVAHEAGAVAREELRNAAAQVSAAAHSVDLQPEQLLVLVKESWASHPELGAHEDRQAMQRTLTEVVSLCIGEFYCDPVRRRV